MISVQRADANSGHVPATTRDDGLRRTIEIALQMRGWPPDGIPGVVPQIAELARAGAISLHGPADVLEQPDAAAISTRPGAWWLTVEDAQHVIAALCPAVRRYTVFDVADIIAQRVHQHDSCGQSAFRLSLIEHLEYAIESEELIPNEHRNDGEILLNEFSVDEWLARKRLPYRLSLTAQSDYEQKAMEAAGRFSIEQVATTLAKETSVDAARWEFALIDAIKGGELPLRNPRNLADSLPYAVPKNLRTFYDCIDVTDVNAWLKAHPEYRTAYRFSIEVRVSEWEEDAFASGASNDQNKPMPRHRHQEQEILRVLRELGHDPLTLPRRTNGRRWVKADVRDKLGYSQSVMDKAWERLAKDAAIKEADA
ncbi:hypothetical protein LGM65_26680 [Burkholderia anthina]|uniref:hypothetical protein n=1 Tax=Burkholderia anthina TaxID=179879 RepID=UPI001CF5D445|nr:hypothetical protein [Burkholderia anthina]MCA8094417.1 hypothetical protein [Burkholderia anthina]